MSNYKEVNLELGMPQVKEAMGRLTFEITHCRALRYSVLKIIHGYGSTGTGGRIRTESRKLLTQMKANGQISDFIIGEEFSIFNSTTLSAFRKCDSLRKDHDLERHNNGVTFILL